MKEGDKICYRCCKVVLKLPLISVEQEVLLSDKSESHSELDILDVNAISTPENKEETEAINKRLNTINETPIKKKHQRRNILKES